MTDIVRPGRRQAALLLHAMPSRDREWAMSQLDPADRVELLALLDELQALSIPADRALLKEAIGTPPVWVGAEPQGRNEGIIALVTGLDQLDETGLRSLFGMLQREPPRLVAVLLRLHDWRWRSRLLESLGRERRRQIEAALAELAGGVPENLGRALLNALTNRFPVATPRAQRASVLASVSTREVLHRMLSGLKTRWGHDARR